MKNLLKDQPNLLQLYLEPGSDANYNTQIPMLIAYSGAKKVMKYCLDYGFNPLQNIGNEGPNLFEVVAQSCIPEIMEVL